MSAKLSFGEKSGYALGDVASNMIWQTLMFFLPIFYTDTFGIPAAAVGTMFIIVRIFDGVNDPIMGSIADRTSTRWGKFRPYILWMAIPYGLAGILMFLTPDLSMTGKLVYAYSTYILMMIIYTAIMIPYNALSGVMTSDYLERTGLNSFRFIGAFIGGLFIQGLALYLVNTLGVDNHSVIHARVNDKQLVFNEVSHGTAKVTVTSMDSDSATVSQDFLVKIVPEGENPPESTGIITELNLNQGFGTFRKDISGLFTDKDHDIRELAASSGSKRIVRAEVRNDTLILHEHSIGTTVVTLTAKDGTGRAANQDIVVRINKKGNKRPFVKDSIPDKHYTLQEGLSDGFMKLFNSYEEEKVPLSGVFGDANSDDLFLTSSSSDPAVASATVLNNQLVIKEKGAGISVIKLAADDGNGGSASTTFTVTIRQSGNLPPETTGKIGDQFLESGFGSRTIDLSSYFTDPDGKSLTWSVKVNNDARGYRLTMSIFAILCIILFLITFASTRERVTQSVREKSRLKDDLKDLMSNGPWIILFVVSLVTLIYVAVRSAVIAYYFKYYVGEPGLTAAFLVIGSLTIIFTLPFTRWLTKKFDKRLLYVISMLLVAASISGYYFTGPEDIWAMFILQILQAVGSAPTMPLLWSMLADAADYSEYKTGRKAMGLIFSASTLAQKIGFGLGGAIALWLLAYYGYQPGVDQSQSSLFGMRMMMSFYPAAGAVACAVLIGFYKLDVRTMDKVSETLKIRSESN
ncbi:MAG TPA: MFS transporter [Bacteroidales bacterium]|nr:MFS transporter [Bacteroidales bacterium]